MGLTKTHETSRLMVPNYMSDGQRPKFETINTTDSKGRVPNCYKSNKSKNDLKHFRLKIDKCLRTASFKFYRFL